MTPVTISSYAIQITAVGIIILGCLAWMFLSIKKRFSSRGRNTACTGCGLAAVCKKPRADKAVDCHDGLHAYSPDEYPLTQAPGKGRLPASRHPTGK